MNRGKILLFIAIALSLGLVISYIPVQPPVLATTPDISVHTIDGNMINLGSLRGAPVLITFWSTTCRSCLLDIPHLIDLYHGLNKKGLEIIGIAMSYDPPNHVVNLAGQKRIPYPVALDIDGSAARAFGNINLTPSSFLIDKHGNIVQYEVGSIDIDNLKRKIENLLGTEKATVSHPDIATYHALV